MANEDNMIKARELADVEKELGDWVNQLNDYISYEREAFGECIIRFDPFLGFEVEKRITVGSKYSRLNKDEEDPEE